MVRTLTTREVRDIYQTREAIEAMVNHVRDGLELQLGALGEDVDLK